LRRPWPALVPLAPLHHPLFPEPHSARGFPHADSLGEYFHRLAIYWDRYFFGFVHRVRLHVVTQEKQGETTRSHKAKKENADTIFSFAGLALRAIFTSQLNIF
jgi:hypothetical protein